MDRIVYTFTIAIPGRKGSKRSKFYFDAGKAADAHHTLSERGFKVSDISESTLSAMKGAK